MVNVDSSTNYSLLLQVHTTLMNEGDKKYPTWLESFRQEMMTCVSSLETPALHLTAKPETDGEESPRKTRKLEDSKASGSCCCS